MRRHAKVLFAIAALASFFAFAGSASAASSCPNEAIRAEQHSSFLPDCRAYEMVSPAEKNDNDVLGDAGRGRAAVGGGGLLFSSFGGFAGTEGLTGPPMYVASRSANGWSTQPMLPREDQNGRFTAQGRVVAVSDDLSTSAVQAGDPGLTPGAQSGTLNGYLRDSSGAYSLLTPVGASLDASLNPGVFDVASLKSNSPVVFESSLKLTPDATIDQPSGLIAFNGVNIYERFDGGLRLLSILPDPDGPGPLTETAAPEGGYVGPGALVPGLLGGGAAYRAYLKEMHAVSDDGSRVFWTDWGSGQVYARIDGSRTVPVSRSQRTVPDPEQPAMFRGATPDGRFVFFTSEARLTDDSQADTFIANLYRYDMQTETLQDLTPAPEAKARGVIGFSDDGQTVYFAAEGNLAPGSDAVPNSSEYPKVYVWSHGVTSYLATLSGLAVPGSTDARNWVPYYDLAFKESRVSPDGRYLLLASDVLLSRQGDGTFEVAPYQLYLYDANDPAQGFACVSCEPGEEVPTAASTIGVTRQDGKSPSIAPTLNRALLPGGRVVFTTTQALDPADRNGKRDVYLWADGKQSLLSTGKADSDSYFLDASGDGGDIFIVTRQQLVGRDTDANLDAYDVRVGGGFPEPPAPLPPCTGEACQGSAGPPVAATSVIATSSVDGRGNAAPRKSSRKRCPKKTHLVKKRGHARCVKKRSHRHRAHRRAKHGAHGNAKHRAKAKPTTTRRHG